MSSESLRFAKTGPYVDPEKEREKREAAKDATLGEAFDVGAGQMIGEESVVSRDIEYEDSGIARLLNISTPLRERNDKLREMGHTNPAVSKIITRHTIQNPYAANEVDWKAAADEAKLMGHDIETDAFVLQGVSDELKGRRQYAQTVRDRMGLGAQFAEFGGMLVGGTADMAATAPLWLLGPVGFSRTIQSFANTAKVIGKAALFEATLQTALEPRIHGWKEDINSRYTWKDSAVNVAAVAAFSGTISAASIGISRMIDRLPVMKKRMAVRERRRVMASLEEFKRATEFAPDQEGSFRGYMDDLGTEGEYQSTLKVGDYDTPVLPDEALEIRVTPTREEVKAKPKTLAQLNAEYEAIVDLAQAFRDMGDEVEFKLLMDEAELLKKNVEAEAKPKEKSQEGIDKEFMEWFGDSVVKDENGIPIRLYRGLTEEERYRRSGQWAWFTDSKDTASSFAMAAFHEDYPGANVVPAYVKLENPLVIDAEGAPWHSISHEGETLDSGTWVEKAETEGYDGIIVKNVKEGGDDFTTTAYVVINHSQFRSSLSPGEALGPGMVTKLSHREVKEGLDQAKVDLKQHKKELAKLKSKYDESTPDIVKETDDRVSFFEYRVNAAQDRFNDWKRQQGQMTDVEQAGDNLVIAENKLNSLQEDFDELPDGVNKTRLDRAFKEWEQADLEFYAAKDKAKKDAEVKVKEELKQKLQAEQEAKAKPKEELQDDPDPENLGGMLKPALIDWLLEAGVNKTKTALRKTKKEDLLSQAQALSKASRETEPETWKVTNNRNHEITRLSAKETKGKTLTPKEKKLLKKLKQEHLKGIRERIASKPEVEPEVKMVVDNDAIRQLKDEREAARREAAIYQEAGDMDEARWHKENARDLTAQIKMLEKGTPAQVADDLADKLPEGIDMDDVVPVGKDDDGNIINENFVDSIRMDDAKEDALKDMLECMLDG